jgi:hypothetical protein
MLVLDRLSRRPSPNYFMSSFATSVFLPLRLCVK